MFPQPSDADHPRSVMTLTQIDTFLALVEQGSVIRAAESLGVGRSTVSAHSKLIADEIGHHHFRRLNGAVVVTEAGLEAYNRFRPLLAHAAFCVSYFRSGSRLSPLLLPVLLPKGFPGSLLDRALDRASERLAARHPQLCLLPTYAANAPAPDELGFAYAQDAGGAIPDRWLLIRAGSAVCRKDSVVSLGDLAEMRIHAPRLPAALQVGLASLVEQANASLEWTDSGIAEIMSVVTQSPRAGLIVPASLFNPALADEAFDCRLIESTSFDPAIAVSGTDAPAVVALLEDELRALHGSWPVKAAKREMLPLKYARSFLALYEEGNVGRAAQRLSIVQPALSVQLHRIEEQTGCSLFSRSHHGLRANERADALYRLLRPLIASFGGTLRHLRASAGRRAAPIRVGLIPALDDESLMSQGFAAALDKWSRLHPDEVLQVMEGYSGTLVRWLRSGMVDFALVDRFFADPELMLEPIVEDRMAVVVACGSDMLAPGTVGLRQLAGLPLVLPSARHGLRTLLTQSLSRHGLALQPRIEIDSMAGCLNMVKIGRYATILPMGSVYKSSNRRGVSVHEIRDPQIVRTICLARARNKPGREAEADFLEALRLAFAGPVDHPPARLAMPASALVEIPLAS
jgi:LysR family nitrogen assimilation transcriptional regulator